MDTYKIDWYGLRSNPYGVFVSRRSWCGRRGWDLVDCFDTLDKAKACVSARLAEGLPQYFPEKLVL